MKNGGKIGLLASLTALGAGLVWAFRSEPETQPAEKEKPADQEKEPVVEKVYGDEAEDSFISQSNAMIKAALKPSNLFENANYEKDLKRWGTTQGIIDVADDKLAKKKLKKRLNNMGEVGAEMYKKSMPKVVETRHKKDPKKYNEYYKWLREEFHKLQVTITNTSTTERTVRLWGGNQGISVSPPAPEDVEDHEVIIQVGVPSAIGVGTHPQGVAVNPANGLAYVVNQISNNVTVIDSAGQVVTVIQLQPSLIPGFNSPVAVAVNTNNASPNYGMVYVAGSVSNTVSVIDLSHTVSNEIPVGVRPMDLAFNPVNDNLYVANLFSDNVSVIDTSTETVSTTLNVGTDPLGVGINTNNGDIYIANSGSDDVSVFDSSNALVTTIAAVGTKPVSATYHSLNDEMYVVAADSNNVFPITAATHTLLAPIATGNSPYKSVFNTNNDYLYVGNRADNTLTVIAPDKSIRATISKGNVNIGFAVGQAENQLWVTDTTANLTNLIGYSDQSSSITISDNYGRDVKNFIHNPAIVKHTKWVLSGEARFKVLTFTEESQTGTKKSWPISLENYRSPKNFLNVSEVMDLEGTVIDGNTSWLFKVAGQQTISILVYFRQFQFKKYLPIQSPKMELDNKAHGIPDSWKKQIEREQQHSNKQRKAS